MPRILTGIQSSGQIHLGNVLGAILPALATSARSAEASYFFIADLHALTSVHQADVMRQNVRGVAAAWLACGLDPQKDVFYRQSHVPEVCELAWMLNCFAPYPMLANAHSFKDKSENLAMVSAGLFTYPVLMAADILLYDAHIVPVGKDQKQHLEMAKDIAASFNRQVGQEVFILPEPQISQEVMTIPGTDGRKMSKSYGNTISIFLPEKELKKRVSSIVTDSTPVEAPKNPDTCNVFAIYSTVATPQQTEDLRRRYLAGGLGYGHAKAELLELLVQRFGPMRDRYLALMDDPAELERQLQLGEDKARSVATVVLQRARLALGLR